MRRAELSTRSTRAGSTASISRRYTSRAASRSTASTATVMSRPTTASARSKPAQAASALSTTPREVKPSVRACSPSATSAADPIWRPTVIRYRATSSLPRKPTTPARASSPRWSSGFGSDSRRSASTAATTADAAMTTTTTIPARSSARP